MQPILQITSRDNAHVREARRVRDGRQDDKIFIEGVRLIEEAIRSGTRIDSLFLSNEGRARASNLIEMSRAHDCFQLSNSAFESISDTVSTQGVIALAVRPESGVAGVSSRLSKAAVPLAVYLDRTNNPSNLGAVMRVTEAAGAAGVIVSKGSADVFCAKSLRAAMGSGFRLPVWTQVDLGEAIQWATKNDLVTIATKARAKRSYLDIDWTRPSMLILGSEAHGISDDDLTRVSERVSIPMETSVESLNLAVACGVVLFEARRQNLTR